VSDGGGSFAFTNVSPLELRTLKSGSRKMDLKVVHLEPRLDAELFGTPGRFPVVAGRLRVEGEIADVAVQLAWQPAPGRTHYAMLNPALCKELALQPGDEVTFRFNPVDPSVVQLPEALSDALARSAAHRKKFEKLTPGQQRACAAFVRGVKSEAAQAKRVAEVFERISRGEPVGPPRRGSRPR
jgi:hypothetical protein